METGVKSTDGRGRSLGYRDPAVAPVDDADEWGRGTYVLGRWAPPRTGVALPDGGACCCWSRAAATMGWAWPCAEDALWIADDVRRCVTSLRRWMASLSVDSSTAPGRARPSSCRLSWVHRDAALPVTVSYRVPLGTEELEDVRGTARRTSAGPSVGSMFRDAASSARTDVPKSCCCWCAVPSSPLPFGGCADNRDNASSDDCCWCIISLTVWSWRFFIRSA